MRIITINREDLAILNGACKPKAGEAGRPVLECLAIGKGEIATADGYIMARVKKVSVAGDEIILVNAAEITNAFKGARKNDSLALDLDSMIGTVGSGGPITFTRQEGKFPDLDAISIAASKEKIVATLSITTEMLKKLMGICSSDRYITLKVPINKEREMGKESWGVVASGVGYKTEGGIKGVFMPCALNAFKESNRVYTKESE